MAYANQVRSSELSSGGLVERVSRAVKSMFEGGEQRRVYKRTLRELNDLTNRDLADLGIHRSQIEKLAYEAAYTK